MARDGTFALGRVREAVLIMIVPLKPRQIGAGTKRLFLILSLTLSPWLNAQEQPVVLKANNGTRGRGQVIQNTIIVVEGGTKAAGA
jgi:hypothetical protein